MELYHPHTPELHEAAPDLLWAVHRILDIRTKPKSWSKAEYERSIADWEAKAREIVERASP